MKKLNILIIIILHAACYMLYANYSEAANLESSGYRIQNPNVNIGAKDQTSGSYKISTTIGQTSANEFQSAGYIVRAGFQYLRVTAPFRFTVSSTNINLGTLAPNTPSTAGTLLTVSYGASGEYRVTAREENQLNTQSGNIIADTQCNGGGDTCSESTAKKWDSTQAYGFGYNMTGADIPADFETQNHYRPFPNKATGEAAAIVMSGNNIIKNHQSTMTFKVNVSPEQPGGSYGAIVNLTAIPSF